MRSDGAIEYNFVFSMYVYYALDAISLTMS